MIFLRTNEVAIIYNTTKKKCKDCLYYKKRGDRYVCEEPRRQRDKRFKIFVGGGRKACKFFKFFMGRC